ncbi:MAG: 50S ribosomal protein L3 N(5)-glutamine methyltransferase [Gammaproteobacteria bacterium]|nr:50S ribosomal protein L3 N(5)-glutamine methyltransferase [Gammaproteobacteria bacterium]
MKNTQGIDNGVIDELFTIRDLIRYGITLFTTESLYFGHGADNAMDEATALTLYVLRLPNDLPGHFMDARLTTQEKGDILDLFERRSSERVPAAYLTHEAWFAGHKFYVDSRVLVPRSPIAELINAEFSPWMEAEGIHNVLDMCTGGGCIAIACAHVLPDADVDAVDISDDALAVATINVEKHGMEDQVNLIKSDLFSNLDGKKYDLIVTNPPYVDAEEMSLLPNEFQHEPVLGLASGADGLDAIRIILETAAHHLTDNGVLIAEVGASDVALEEAFPDVPFFWFDFEHGGSGVFMLSRDQLIQYFS